MQLDESFVRRGRDDRVGVHGLAAVRVEPAFPQAGESEQSLIRRADAPFRAVAGGSAPFEKRADRHEAAAVTKGGAVGLQAGQRLDTCVDAARAEPQVLGPGRHQPPARQRTFPFH